MPRGPDEHDSSTRIDRLVSILDDGTGARTSASDPADVHLRNVATERLIKLTTELRDETGTPEVDALTARVLLNEYRAAVMHLRIVAQMAADRVKNAARPVKLGHRAMHRLLKETTEL